MAFPEFSGGYTAEEMEGKTGDAFGGTTIEAEPPRSVPRVTERAPAPKATNGNGNGNGHRTDEQWRLWLDKLRAAIAVVRTRDEVVEIGGRSTVGDALATGPQWVQREISAILAENFGRFPDEPQTDPGVAAALDTEIEIGGEKWAAA
jgi:hypothetical protein